MEAVVWNCSVKNGALKSFTKFTRENLCHSLFLKKQQAASWLKRDSETSVFLRMLQKF